MTHMNHILLFIYPSKGIIDKYLRADIDLDDTNFADIDLDDIPAFETSEFYWRF